MGVQNYPHDHVTNHDTVIYGCPELPRPYMGVQNYPAVIYGCPELPRPGITPTIYGCPELPSRITPMSRITMTMSLP
jgi:hypothetical protein